MLGGHFSEKVISLLNLMKAEDDKFRKSLTKSVREPDSDIAYDVERREIGIHAGMGRDKSSREDFQRVRFGREWPKESWFQHKGYPDWHPNEIPTMGVQKPPLNRKNEFFPEIKVSEPKPPK